MKIGFTKMHGCGNDYIYVNGAEAAIDERKKEGIVRKLSDRHFGIGGDGVIFIHSLSGEDAIADFEMEMYNADGSRAEMCGNGIRCVAKYVYDKGLTDKGKIRIASCGKVKYLDLAIKEGKVANVRVNMGAPILAAEDIPVISGMTCVSMGNPHAVVFMKAWEDLDSFALEKIGPYFENHMRFPKRTNTEFVKVIDRNTVQMRVWERGTGETLACGTGACATVVACVLNGLTEEEVTVKLLGGELKVQWDRENNTVYMAGPAETVFDGMIEIDGMD